MLAAIVLGLAIGHVADQFRRGFYDVALPGRGAAAVLLPLLGILLLTVSSIPPLWQGQGRGYARARIVGIFAVLAGLLPYQPYRAGLFADLYQAFWISGPHRLTTITLLSLVGMGSLLAFVGVRGQCSQDESGGPTDATLPGAGQAGRGATLLALLTYAWGLACFANPQLVAAFGPAWAPLPLAQPVGFWPLLFVTMLLLLLAETLYRRRPPALQTVIWLNSGGTLLAAWTAFAFSVGAGLIRLAIHLLLMAWVMHPKMAKAFGRRRGSGAESGAWPSGTT